MIAAFALFALQAGVTAAHVEEYRQSAAEIRRVFDREMLDYPSARFRDVHVTVNLDVPAPRGAYLCGYVNGKNRMGAYTGWQQFVASDYLDGSVTLRTGDEIMDALVDVPCGEGGNHASDPVDRSAWLAPR